MSDGEGGTKRSMKEIITITLSALLFLLLLYALYTLFRSFFRWG